MNIGFCGHTLGYLLWGLTEIERPLRHDVYHSLVHGKTVSWLGTCNEAYAVDSTPYTEYGPKLELGLWVMETGVNLAGIAQYWKLPAPTPSRARQP